MTAERGNSKGRRTIGGLIQSDWPRRNRGLESEVLQGSSTPEGGNNQLVRLEGKEVLRGSSNPRGGNNQLVRLRQKCEVLWGSSNPEGRQQPTCTPGRKGSFAGIFEPTAWQQPTCTPREKHEAMNGTGDMARNPKIKRRRSDAKTKGRRPETRNVIIGDIL